MGYKVKTSHQIYERTSTSSRERLFHKVPENSDLNRNGTKDGIVIGNISDYHKELEKEYKAK